VGGFVAIKHAHPMTTLPSTAHKLDWTPFPLRFRTLAAACRCMKDMEKGGACKTDETVPAAVCSKGRWMLNPEYAKARYEIEFYLVPAVKKRLDTARPRSMVGGFVAIKHAHPNCLHDGWLRCPPRLCPPAPDPPQAAGLPCPRGIPGGPPDLDGPRAR
jgi:hypothetical protein